MVTVPVLENRNHRSMKSWRRNGVKWIISEAYFQKFSKSSVKAFYQSLEPHSRELWSTSLLTFSLEKCRTGLQKLLSN